MSEEKIYNFPLIKTKINWNVTPYTEKKEEVMLSGTLLEIVQKYEKLKKTYRYINDVSFAFKNYEDAKIVADAYDNLSYGDQIDLYYGNGVVD